jgi:hypothetical protein
MFLLCLFARPCISDRTFKIVGNEFQMDGQPFRYISGSFHYFQQHPDSWEDTIKKMATGGLNTIQTYIAWNIHEQFKALSFSMALPTSLVFFLSVNNIISMLSSVPVPTSVGNGTSVDIRIG